MSESRNPERLPDQAALDELQRAFAGDETNDADDATSPGDAPDRADASRADGSPADASPGALDASDPGHAERATPIERGSTPVWLSEDPDLDSPPHEELVIVEQVLPEEEPPPVRPTIRIDGLDAGLDDKLDDGLGASGDAGLDDAVNPATDDEVDAVSGPTSGPSVGPPEPDGTGVDGPRIISIDDADLPDAVYIEGSLDADGSHSIVIIEDDELADPGRGIDDPDTRRGIEPRLRERRVAVRRAQGRKRLRWLLVGVAVVAVVVGTLAVLGSSLFSVRAEQVSITGVVYTDQDALDEVLDDLIGTPTLRADTQGIEDELERIPWVREAKVRVQFPRAATIEIRERNAWATYQGPDGRYRVLDEEGRVLDVLDGYPFAYVLLDGPDPVDLDPGEFAPRGYAVAAELAKNLTGTVRGRVQLIEVTADGSRLELVLDDGLRVRFGEARDLFAKLVRLETVLSTYAEIPPGTVDVSTREVTLPAGALEVGEE